MMTVFIISNIMVRYSQHSLGIIFLEFIGNCVGLCIYVYAINISPDTNLAEMMPTNSFGSNPEGRQM